jgi:Mn2+/Fe2+ NRAMP family transporter
MLHGIVALLFIANTINIAADLAAMADSMTLLLGGPGFLYIVLFGLGSAAAEIFLDYERYVAILKWSTLSLFTYVAVLAVVHVPWREAIVGALIPQITWSKEFATTLVAIFGTTISPYLFFWQASQEAEDQRVAPDKKPLKRQPQEAASEFRRIRADTYVGMAFSNLIALAIIIAVAATLHGKVSSIETSAQAAEALRPIAGDLAAVIFTVGIVGTGLLAIPVLAGASAYAIAEARRWRVGLGRKPSQARAFYAVIAISVLLGMILDASPINPIAALYWSAVVNGIVAVPVMAIMMSMAADRKAMGAFAITGNLRVLGWLATVAMAASVVAMGVLAII